MERKVFGYARVSTKKQAEDRQVEALLEYGIDERNIIVDKESGKDMERNGYQSLKNTLLRRGDTLVVKELDRLSRNKADIKAELESLKSMGVSVRILNIPTTLVEFSEDQSWVLDMVNNILIEVLGSIAEDERRRIRQRQREGIDCALDRGVAFGRPQVPFPENWHCVMEQVENREITSVEAMRLLNLKKTTYYKLRKMSAC